jgi:hypothetical protein
MTFRFDLLSEMVYLGLGMELYIYILEPVSVGGWTQIGLRRITRSNICVCLRLREFFLLQATLVQLEILFSLLMMDSTFILFLIITT